MALFGIQTKQLKCPEMWNLNALSPWLKHGLWNHWFGITCCLFGGLLLLDHLFPFIIQGFQNGFLAGFWLRSDCRQGPTGERTFFPGESPKHLVIKFFGTLDFQWVRSLIILPQKPSLGHVVPRFLEATGWIGERYGGGKNTWKPTWNTDMIENNRFLKNPCPAHHWDNHHPGNTIQTPFVSSPGHRTFLGTSVTLTFLPELLPIPFGTNWTFLWFFQPRPPHGPSLHWNRSKARTGLSFCASASPGVPVGSRLPWSGGRSGPTLSYWFYLGADRRDGYVYFYVYVYIYICICVYIFLCICIFTYNIYTYTPLYLYTYMHMLYIYMYVFIYMYTYIYI